MSGSSAYVSSGLSHRSSRSEPDLSHPTPQSASKHAVLGMSRSFARDYASEKVRVNVVAPGPIETPTLSTMLDSAGGEELEAVPLGRHGTPEEVATVIAFLLSREASFVTVSPLSCPCALALAPRRAAPRELIVEQLCRGQCYPLTVV